MICVTAGALALALAGPGFTLEWTHSVERIRWHEDWRETPQGLAPVRARVTGSGAGMEPPPEARWRDGAWWWDPRLPARPVVHLGASGATGGGWTICADGTCRTLPETGGTITLRAAPDCAPGNAPQGPAGG